MIYNKKNTEELIEILAKDLKPTKRKGWKFPCVIWCSLVILLILVNYYVFSDFFRSVKHSVKHSFWDLLMNPIFLIGFIASVSSFICAIFAALPGRNYVLWKYISILFFILWGILILYQMYVHENYEISLTEFYYCTTGTIIIGLILFIFVYNFIKKRFVIDWKSTILGGILASSISGTVCVGFICQSHEAAHIFYTHYLPVLILFLIGFIIFFIKNKYFQIRS
jgi:hypothetical protein